MMHAPSQTASGFGRAWFALTVAFGLHVLDEATTGFLNVYNPTVLAMGARYPWFPMPTFAFREWLVALIAGVVFCFALTPLASGNGAGCGRSRGSTRFSCSSTGWGTRCSRSWGGPWRR